MYKHIRFIPKSFNKKILLVFFIATFIPILFLTLITSGYIFNAIEDEVKTNLVKSAKSYALFTFDKLTALSKQLDHISLSFDDSIPSDLASSFDLVELISAKTVTDLQLYTKSRLSILDKANINYLSFERIHISSKGDRYILRGLVNTSNFFGSQETNPFNEPVCIFSQNKTILFCSEGIALQKGVTDMASTLIGANNRIIVKNYANENYLLATWELYLPTYFDTEAWHFVIMKPSSIALSTIKNSNKFLLPIIILFFIIIAYLLHLITLKLLKPLHNIHAATESIAKGQYDIDLQVNTNDEFQVLSDSFQIMSNNIGKTIIKDQVFKVFQHEVLASLNVHTALKNSLSELIKLFQSDSLTIALLDSIYPDQLICHNITLSDDHKDSYQSTYPVPMFNIDVVYSPLDKQDFFNYLKPVSLSFSAELYHFYKVEQNHSTIFYIFFGTKNRDSAGLELTHLNEFMELLRIVYTTHQQRINLNHQANFDDLTNLPNRHNINNYLATNWNLINNGTNKYALLYVDLDNFKNVNDLSGHKTGNEVLILAAKRLHECAEGNGMLARLSGDEFCILIENLRSESIVFEVAEEILSQFKLPFLVNDIPFYLGSSIGIVIGPTDCNQPADLLDNADLAMYKAKQEGKNTYVVFNDSIQEERSYRLSLDHHLHSALDNNELSIKFQPKIDLLSGRLVSAESLIRWNQKELGFVNTELFISLAEESGLINEIGQWILRKSCYQLLDWQSKGLDIESIAVNVSARQLTSKRFIDVVASVLEETKIPPHYLDLEITESAFVNDDSFLTNELYRLHSLGVQISIDDFGKEYSSLSYLKKIPFDNLKIDREFIMELDTDIRDEHIVNVIINIGHTLNKNIIAEGIETVAQRDILIKLGCDIGQGYLYSPPLSDIEFLEFAVNFAHQADTDTPITQSVI